MNETSVSELLSFQPKSNWDRYFSEVVDCEGAYLNKRWSTLYELRCKIAHNALIGPHDFEKIKDLVNEVKEYLQKALDNLDQVHLQDEEKELVAENVISNLSHAYGEFIQLWKQFESLLFDIISENQLQLNTRYSSRHNFMLVFNNGLIDEVTYEIGNTVFNFRNILVHDASISITQNEIDFYTNQLQELINSLKAILKPVSFHKECISRIEKELSQTLSRRSRTTYATQDNQTSLTCAVSKEYNNKNRTGYWFSFSISQKKFVESKERGFVAFGCGSEEKVLLIPFTEFSDLLPNLNVTKSDSRHYWHIRIYQKEKSLYLELSKIKDKNLSQYLI